MFEFDQNIVDRIAECVTKFNRIMSFGKVYFFNDYNFHCTINNVHK